MKIFVVIIALAASSLSSCMMAGMGCMDHSSGHSDHANMKSTVVEAQNQNIKTVLEIPPLTMDAESEIMVRVTDRLTNSAISGAAVLIVIKTGEMMPMEHASSSGHEMEAIETNVKGVYSVKHRFDMHGSIGITAKVIYPEGTEPLIVSTAIESMSSMGGHGSKSSMMTPMIIIGAAAMVVMMAFMLGRNY